MPLGWRPGEYFEALVGRFDRWVRSCYLGKTGRERSKRIEPLCFPRTHGTVRVEF